MKTAVIIVNYNCQKYLPDLLNSLAKLNYPAKKADIFFVDNASTDTSLAWAQNHAPKLKHHIYFIKNDKNLGFAGGNNTAIHKALKLEKYKYIVLLNIDTVVDKNWLSELVQKAESNSQIGAAQSLIMMHGQPEVINTSGNKLHYLGFGWSGNYQRLWVGVSDPHPKGNQCVKMGGGEDTPTQPRQIGYASGAAVLYRADVLQKVGLLDEKFFMYHEDLELSWRIRLAGFKIVLAQQSIVYHKYQFSRHKKKWLWTERNRLLTYFSLYKLRTLILFAPIFIFVEFGVLVYSLIDGWFWRKIKAYCQVLASIPYIVKKRRQIHSIRQISDRQILGQMTPKLNFPEINGLASTTVNPILQWYFKIMRPF
jgi:GT2 family glycosyltransferase